MGEYCAAAAADGDPAVALVPPPAKRPYGEYSWCSTKQVFDNLHGNITLDPHYPADAEFLNKEIPHYGWMSILFGPCPRGFPEDNHHAHWILSTIAKGKTGAASEGKSRAASKGKSADTSKGKSRAASKGKSADTSKGMSHGASKTVDDDNSDDDYTPRGLARYKAMCKRAASSKAVADENSDDDFMPPSRTHGRAK